MSEPFIAEIVMFGGNFAPRGWALCDGELLAISSNSALFSILGTTYGGDGRTTFGLPDLRGRVPVHAGNGPGLSSRRLGEKGGAESTALAAQNLPPHNHGAGDLKVQANTAGGNTEDPSGAALGEAPNNLYNAATPDTAMAAGSVGGATANTGGGTAFNNMQPYLTVNFIIVLQGIYPSRS